VNIQTKGYNVGPIVLPDFNNEFRSSKGDELIRVTTEPLLTSEECDGIIFLVEEHFQGNWTKLPSGRYEIAGSWIKDVPTVKEKFNTLLKEKLFPSLASLFPDVVRDASDLRIQSAYIFKYTPESGEKTDMHMDSSLLSFTILLNDPQEFEGGGTFYESLGTHGEVIHMQKGEVCFRPAGLRHRGQPITRGQRYVIGGFVTVASDRGCEHTRQLLTRGTKALADGDTARAKDLFGLAKMYCPKFSETYMSYAHCLRKFGDVDGAQEAYKAAFDANPRNADSAFMVGVMYGEKGNDEEAMRWYQLATKLNEHDGDAWYRQGLVYARQGLTTKEREMYERAIQVQPNHADAHCNLGCSYGEEGDIEREIECYERALQIEPNNSDALNNAKAAYYYKGIDAYRRGDFDGALHCFDRILNGIAPGETTVLAAYSAVLKEKQQQQQHHQQQQQTKDQ
jgi:superkiller protein 3